MQDFKLKKKYILLTSLVLTLGLSQVNVQAEETGVLGLPLHGFMDVGYYQATNGQPNKMYDQGFRTNGLDLYLAPDFGNRVRALAEVNIDPNADSRGTDVGIDYERMQLGYVFSPYLTAWIGRFHTPMGAYIIQSHHGAMLQTAVNKPKFIDFEDKYGVMPVHTTGIWLTGNLLNDEDRFNYQFYAGNGSSIEDDSGRLDMNIVHAQAKRSSYGGRLTYFFVDGLQFGVSYLSSDITHFSASGNTPNPAAGTSRINVFAAHLVYDANGFEFMNEIYGFKNKTINQDGTSSATMGSYAAFSQLAYAFNGDYIPYVRWERGNFNMNDPYFSSQLNGAPYSRYALGFRYNISEKTAIKTEINRTTFDQSSGQLVKGGYNEFAFQYAIRF